MTNTLQLPWGQLINEVKYAERPLNNARKALYRLPVMDTSLNFTDTVVLKDGSVRTVAQCFNQGKLINKMNLSLSRQDLINPQKMIATMLGVLQDSLKKDGKFDMDVFNHMLKTVYKRTSKNYL